jgi:ketosteroid isomerase-like protein
MAQEADNVAILKEGYKHWRDSKGGSVDHWMSICAENIKFGSLAQGRPKVEYLTSYSSRTELGRYFEGLNRDWEMIEYKAEEFVAQGDRVIMLGHCSWRHRQSGKVVSTPKADTWRFANGKAVEFYEFFDTAQLQAALA